MAKVYKNKYAGLDYRSGASVEPGAGWIMQGSSGKWVTMGIPSDGSYGIPEGIMYGVPVTCANGKYQRVTGLEIDAFSQECINKTLAELEGEKDGVKHLL